MALGKKFKLGLLEKCPKNHEATAEDIASAWAIPERNYAGKLAQKGKRESWRFGAFYPLMKDINLEGNSLFHLELANNKRSGKLNARKELNNLGTQTTAI